MTELDKRRKNGHWFTKEAAKNKAIVAEYIRRNPYNTQSQCATDLGLSRSAVNAHFKVLKREHELRQKATYCVECEQPKQVNHCKLCGSDPVDWEEEVCPKCRENLMRILR